MYRPRRMSLTIRIATAIGLATLCQWSAFASMDVTAPIPFDGTGLERGVVLIHCHTDIAHVVRQSRGSVLDLGQPHARRDLVLTAAHGLPDTAEAILRSCRALGLHGRPYRISAVWRGPSNSGDIANDWAVLLVDGRIRGEVGRLPPGNVSGEYWSQLAAAEAPVRLVLRQAEPADGDCHLRRLVAPYDYAPTDLLLYSCPGPPDRSRAPGLSGSPIVTGANGRTVVVGIHLGWGLQVLDDGRLHPISIGRPISAEISAAIAEAAREALR